MSMKPGLIKDLRVQGQILGQKLTSPLFMSKIYFRAILGYRLNIKNPITFNECLQYYKLYYCPNNPLIVDCTDKYLVRQYIEKKGMGQYLNELYYVWEKPEDIDWNSLPKQFAMKCTHSCGHHIICDDISKLDISVSKKMIEKRYHSDFGLRNAEIHYSKIKPRIICEKFLGGVMIDYKFFCFNGRVEFMYISEGLSDDHTARISFFDREGNRTPFQRKDYAENTLATIPKQFGLLIELSEILGKDFPFVRVDWFVVNDEIYFSELTFTPCAGLMRIEPIEYDKKLGKLFDMDTIKEGIKNE